MMLGRDDPILTPGVVTNWDGLEELASCPLPQASHVPQGAGCAGHTIVPLSRITNNEKVPKLHFMAFSVPAILVMPHFMLAACSYGCTNDVALGSGVGMISVAMHYPILPSA